MQEQIQIKKEDSKVSFQLRNIVITVKQAGKYFLVQAPSLKIMVQVKDLSEAPVMIQEALGELINDMYDRQTLGNYLEELGWEKKGPYSFNLEEAISKVSLKENVLLQPLNVLIN